MRVTYGSDRCRKMPTGSFGNSLRMPIFAGYHMARRAIISAVLALFLCGTTSATAGEATADRQSGIVALTEGKVTIYQQGPAIFDELFHAFEQENPGIQIDVKRGRYELGQIVDNELSSGEVQADIIILQTLLDFDRWNEQGALSKYEPAGYGQVTAGLKTPEGGVMAFAFTLSGIGYNAAQVSDELAPKMISDFAKPEFSGKIASTYPHDDDTTLWRYGQIVDKYGWSFVERLLSQQIYFVRSHLALGRAVDSGSWPITFEQFQIFSNSRFVAPQDFPLLAIPLNVALMKDAPHPEASKLFLQFLLSTKGQKLLLNSGFYPARKDVVLESEMAALLENDIDFGYLSFLRDRSRVESLRSQFRKLIGEPQGDYLKAIETAP